MSPHFVLGRENVPCVTEVVNRSLKADCTDFTLKFKIPYQDYTLLSLDKVQKYLSQLQKWTMVNCSNLIIPDH